MNRSGGANQKFSSPLPALRRGVWGEPHKKMKGKFLGLPRERSERPEARQMFFRISRFATGKKFGLHHIDGASQNKAQILVPLWRKKTENPRGFSTGFATKQTPPDPAKAGSMFSEHSAHSCSEPIFFLSLSRKLKQ